MPPGTTRSGTLTIMNEKGQNVKYQVRFQDRSRQRDLFPEWIDIETGVILIPVQDKERNVNTMHR